LGVSSPVELGSNLLTLLVRVVLILTAHTGNVLAGQLAGAHALEFPAPWLQGSCSGLVAAGLPEHLLETADHPREGLIHLLGVVDRFINHAGSSLRLGLLVALGLVVDRCGWQRDRGLVFPLAGIEYAFWGHEVSHVVISMDAQKRLHERGRFGVA